MLGNEIEILNWIRQCQRNFFKKVFRTEKRNRIDFVGFTFALGNKIEWKRRNKYHRCKKKWLNKGTYLWNVQQKVSYKKNFRKGNWKLLSFFPNDVNANWAVLCSNCTFGGNSVTLVASISDDGAYLKVITYMQLTCAITALKGFVCLISHW